MMSIIETLWRQISPYFHMLSASGNFQVSQGHHEAIFNGIQHNQVHTAHQALHDDIADAFEVLKRFF